MAWLKDIFERTKYLKPESIQLMRIIRAIEQLPVETQSPYFHIIDMLSEVHGDWDEKMELLEITQTWLSAQKCFKAWRRYIYIYIYT